MAKKKSKLTPKYPNIKRDIKDFLLNEEGNITKKDIVKMGLGLMVLGLGLKSNIDAKAEAPNNTVCDRCSAQLGQCHPWY